MYFKELDLEITEQGEVYFQGKRQKTRRSTRGYQEIGIPLHRLVAQAFHGSPPTRQHVCHHKDANPHNNSSDNLEWLTQGENHRRRTIKRKLTKKQVTEILSMKPAPHITMRAMARSFGVAYATLKHARNRRTWKNGWQRHNHGKLTPGQLKKTLEWTPRIVSAVDVARKYHVSDATVLNIWHGRYRREHSD